MWWAIRSSSASWNTSTSVRASSSCRTPASAPAHSRSVVVALDQPGRGPCPPAQLDHGDHRRLANVEPLAPSPVRLEHRAGVEAGRRALGESAAGERLEHRVAGRSFDGRQRLSRCPPQWPALDENGQRELVVVVLAPPSSRRAGDHIGRQATAREHPVDRVDPFGRRRLATHERSARKRGRRELAARLTADRHLDHPVVGEREPIGGQPEAARDHRVDQRRQDARHLGGAHVRGMELEHDLG